jgi:hypothetical protein
MMVPSSEAIFSSTARVIAMALVPWRFETAMVTPGWAPASREWNMTYDVGSASPSRTRARSRTRIGRSAADATTTFWSASASRMRAPASTVCRSLPCTTPAAGSSTLLPVIACCTCSGSIPYAASRAGSISTETSRGRPPIIVTSETSGTSLMASCSCPASSRSWWSS